ncbi:MAG: sigma-70 family RNA polymerase sigma factor [Eubacteriales bacterium]|nr:sigma-70 family RNA polymerase sigma factor [Eubacteriales bacterium]
MNENKYAENIELLRDSKNGNEKAKEKLVLLNSGLVNSIAQRFVGRGTDIEDLKELGMLGLVKAIESFDESRGCAFSTYAVPLIFGEIRKFLRDDGIIKVSRSNKKLGAQLMAAKEKLAKNGESDVSLATLARMCNTTPEEATIALESCYPVSSLSDTIGDGDGMTVENTVYDEDECERNFDKLAISLAIEKLPPMQKKIILLRYFRNYSQQKTAAALGLTQVKISREEKKILAKLAKELA